MMNKSLPFVLALVASSLLFASAVKIDGVRPHVTPNHIGAASGSNYKIGTGIYDVTGPTAEEGMMGYAMPQQRAGGLHLRLWARAYVFVDDAGTRFVLVSSDICMTFQAIKIVVVNRLLELYNGMYTHDNVMLTGIHTHSGPGGFSWDVLYDITDLGFSDQNFEAIVSGIVEAIERAHDNLSTGGSIQVNQDWLDNSNINRSPYSYLFNPAEERAKYLWDTDKNMTVMRLEDASGGELGAISWFPVHCTSMNNTNRLISSDNKGYASYLFEKTKNGNGTIMGQGKFVAAFGQSNEGDVSPNTAGPHCPNGSACDFATSTCNGKTEMCISPGPGADIFESTQIIGANQFKKALSMYEDTAAAVPVQGPIKFIHTWLNMTNIAVDGKYTPSGKPGKTCQAAYGYSFAAGTTDGPGAFDFTQNDNKTGNVFWDFIKTFIAKPTAEQIACQAPKPILLDVGLTKPMPWVPDVVPIQIATIGQIILIAVPAEFTTMAGRRLRDTVKNALLANGFPAQPEPIPIIVGLANTYTSYVATFEEYQVQRYEAASTIFGPHTLSAYQQEYEKLAIALATNKTVPPGPAYRDLSNQTFNFQLGVIGDVHPIGGAFGNVIAPPAETYKIGDTVSVTFQGANPRNNLMTMSTFLTVEHQVNGQWVVVLTDADWDTKMHWKRVLEFESHIIITWDISSDVTPGTYRITHSGYSKNDPLFSTVFPYSGATASFTVTA